MSEHDLNDLLERIEREIQLTKPEDERGRELLRHIEGDIRKFREQPAGKRSEAEDSFIERMNDAIDHFEITHPTLTTMISQMLTILSNAGI